jgi:methionine sulfoxide reductase catalytic subunit
VTDSVEIKLPHGPITPTLSAADDRITVSNWLPPQDGIVPRIRIGRRWISTLWVIPIGAAALIILIALAQSLGGLPSVQAFIKDYPGIAQSAPSVDTGFPWWLQL